MPEQRDNGHQSQANSTPSRPLSLRLALRHPRKFVFRLLGREEDYHFDQGPEGLRARKYRNYDAYLRHQASKYDKLQRRNPHFREDIIRGKRNHIVEHVPKLGVVQPGMRVLCLAARAGGEVLGFWELGCFGFGTDLNPGESNPYVCYGDFHEIQLPDACCDVVYCNSLDHAFQLAKVISEIRRVLVPGGFAIIEADANSDTGGNMPGPWEATVWESAEDLARVFHEQGFSTRHEIITGRQKMFALELDGPARKQSGASGLL